MKLDTALDTINVNPNHAVYARHAERSFEMYLEWDDETNRYMFVVWTFGTLECDTHHAVCATQSAAASFIAHYADTSALRWQ
jgi:hypothetical protein